MSSDSGRRLVGEQGGRGSLAFPDVTSRPLLAVGPITWEPGWLASGVHEPSAQVLQCGGVAPHTQLLVL
eukprot:363248-Chlamydomonas_euryale.AAC.6